MRNTDQPTIQNARISGDNNFRLSWKTNKQKCLRVYLTNALNFHNRDL